MRYVAAILLMLASDAVAQQPRMVPYQDVTVPAQHWRRVEVWEQRWSLLMGHHWQRRVTWMPLYPERNK